MERDTHHYVPIDSLQQENRYGSAEDNYSSGGIGISRSSASGGVDSLLEDCFYLEHVGQVGVVLSTTQLVWRRARDQDQKLDASLLACWGQAVCGETRWELPVAEIYAVELEGLGPVSLFKSTSICGLLKAPQQLHRVVVHSFCRSENNSCQWIPKAQVFGHANAEVAQAWVEKIQTLLDHDIQRPKTLLVFVNPYGGKGAACQTWELVTPLFDRARIKTKVIKTERAGHAYDIMNEATIEELNSQDGVVIVGGDGLFNEVLNGLVRHRHRAQPATMPHGVTNFLTDGTGYQDEMQKHQLNLEIDQGVLGGHSTGKSPAQEGGLKQMACVGANSDSDFDRSSCCPDHHPLLQEVPFHSLSKVAHAGNLQGASATMISSAVGREGEPAGLASGDTPGYDSISVTVPVWNQQGDFLSSTSAEPEPIIGAHPVSVDGLDMQDIDLPTANLVHSHPKVRLGIIPAGSTDTVAISTTGVRDPVTSALHIILGDSMPLDIVRITSWKRKALPDEKPQVRYAASFAGYGFYGDVMKESETLRWMGPARYDVAGFKVFMRHKKYEAEISFLEIPHISSIPTMPHGPWTHAPSFSCSKPMDRENKKVVCRVNCAICAKGFDFSHLVNNESESEGSPTNDQTVERPQAPRWRTCRTHFHSIGAAIMSCRNEKAPDGVAAHAHLADGLLHLILIRECSRPAYLRKRWIESGKAQGKRGLGDFDCRIDSLKKLGYHADSSLANRQLLRLTRRGADPFNFNFVEHYQTPVFTFLSHGKDGSVWNVDGELFPAHQLSAQVFRGLVNVFARGPEI